MTAFFVDVITTLRDDPNTVTHTRRINYENSRSRRWLGEHSNWALRTGHAVHTAATTDDALPMALRPGGVNYGSDPAGLLPLCDPLCDMISNPKIKIDPK